MSVHVDEETPETVEMQTNLGGDLRRTHALYHEGLVAIGPCLEAVGSLVQTVRAFREGDLGSYGPLFRPSGGIRLLVAFTEGAFREENLVLPLARPAAMLVAGWDPL